MAALLVARVLRVHHAPRALPCVKGKPRQGMDLFRGSLSGRLVPAVMALAPLPPVIGDLQAQAVRAAEEGGPVVRRILAVQRRLAGLDAGGAQSLRRGAHLRFALHPQAEVMQAGRVRVVRRRAARRAQDVAEMAVVVLHMRLAAECEAVLAETERGEGAVVEGLGR